MKKITRLLTKMGLATCYGFLTMQAAIAEDTEIFFAPSSSTKDIKPNVMFIIDTSGSMNRGVDGSSNVAEEDKRLSIVKGVMNDLLSDLDNVNAGLMRFNRGNSSDGSARGGPVLYPVLDIDLPATPIVEQEIEDGNDDGYEDNTKLTNLTSQQLLIDGASANYTAIRFSDLNLPQGVKIKSALVSFTARGNSAGGAKFNIYGEKSVDAATFVNAPAEIGLRAVNRTVAEVSWTPSDWTSLDSYSTEDISPIIQEVIDQSAWCGGNDLVLLIEGTGNAARAAFSAEGEAAYGGGNDDSDNVTAPRIRIEYDTVLPATASGCITGDVASQVSNNKHDTESNLGDYGSILDFTPSNIVGVAFQGVNIPKDAKITEAFLQFRANGYDSSSTNLAITAINSNAPPMNSSMTASTNLTGAVTWNGVETWSSGSRYLSPSVASIVQSLVNRADWNANDDMAFLITAASGHRRASSRNDRSNRAARLLIKYQTVYSPSTVTLREDLKREVQALPATGNTPISDTIAEAGLYFTGGEVLYGKNRNKHKNNRVSHSLSYINGTLNTPSGCTPENPDADACSNQEIVGSASYVSPITESCQSNHIIYLTDGAPTSHHSETESIYSKWTGGGSCDHGNPRADCAVDIAGYLHNNDISPLEGKQSVNTHMIGFGAGADPALMKLMADAGGGGHYSAQSKDELVTVLKSIVDSISAVSTTFVTTGVTVNQYNRLTHSDELYYALFTPDAKSIWPGNIKRYQFNNGNIVDVNGVNAVDSLTAEFNDDSQSFWSTSTDGNVVSDGGVADKLSNNRVIYTNLNSTSLTDANNRFNETNIKETHVGAIDDTDRKTVVHWALGYDVNHADYDINNPSKAPAHKTMADPLHSQPTIVSYKNGTTESRLVYVGTNDGFLRVFDTEAKSGEEVWSFMPTELMGRLSSIQKGVTTGHNYGLDGSITYHLEDTNNNGFVDVGEKAYLYVGMRRGGRSYYALDISNPTTPKLQFIISGDTGVGVGQVASNYAKLGQTWSRPIIGKMDLPKVNSDKLVMMFGGGYDSAQDLAGTAANTDTIGNMIYIADALSGELLWSSDDAKDPGEKEGPLSLNSVPADLTAFDIDNDDLVDHIYASDTKAQIFRFDVDKDTQTIKGGRIASLQTAADVANNRRFYYPVDAALIKLIDDSFISVSIGSGYRSHPLDLNVNDHFYMVRDEGVLKGQFDMDVTLDNLTDVTSLVGDSNGDGTSDAQAQMELDGNFGWYLDFPIEGEKVIERSITFNNAVLFNTYLPPNKNSSSCVAAAGGSRIYGLQIVDGNPYVDTNFDGQMTEADRTADLLTPGIAPPPQIIIDGMGNFHPCVGLHCDPIPLPEPYDGIVGYKWQN